MEFYVATLGIFQKREEYLGQSVLCDWRLTIVLRIIDYNGLKSVDVGLLLTVSVELLQLKGQYTNYSSCLFVRVSFRSLSTCLKHFVSKDDVN